MWVAVLDTIFPKGFNADSMRYVPFGNGAQFEMAIKNDTAKSGAPFCLLEVKTPYEVYLNGLDKQEIANLKDVQTKLGKYSGLMIGSLFQVGSEGQGIVHSVLVERKLAFAERIEYRKRKSIRTQTDG